MDEEVNEDRVSGVGDRVSGDSDPAASFPFELRTLDPDKRIGRQVIANVEFIDGTGYVATQGKAHQMMEYGCAVIDRKTGAAMWETDKPETIARIKRVAGIAAMVLLFVAASLIATVSCQAAVIKAKGDLSGMAVKAGDVLDLGGQSFKLTKRITSFGTVRNGQLIGVLAQHEAAVEIPKAAVGASVENVKFVGGSYNGLVRDYGSQSRIINCTVLPGTGWGVQLIDSSGPVVDGLVTKDLRRGGIYVFATDYEIRNSHLDGADEEAPLRVQKGSRGRVFNTYVNNTRSRSQKEALQLRGVSGAVENCTILGSIAAGQTPVGEKQTAVFSIRNSEIFGYVRNEAGGDLTIENCRITIADSYTRQEKGKAVVYRLALSGGGYAIANQPAARDLPKGKAKLANCTVIAPTLSTAIKPTLVNVKFAIAATQPATKPATLPATAPATLSATQPATAPATQPRVWTIMQGRDVRPDIYARLNHMAWNHPVDLGKALPGFDQASEDSVLAAHVAMAKAGGEIYVDDEAFPLPLLVRCAVAMKQANPAVRLVVVWRTIIHPDSVLRAMVLRDAVAMQELNADIASADSLYRMADLILVNGYFLGPKSVDRDFAYQLAAIQIIKQRYPGTEVGILGWGLWHTAWNKPNTPLSEEAIRRQVWLVKYFNLRPVLFAPEPLSEPLRQGLEG